MSTTPTDSSDNATPKGSNGTLGTRKRIEWHTKKKTVRYKYLPINSVSTGWSNDPINGESFSISVDNSDVEVSIRLTKDQIERVVNFFHGHLNSSSEVKP